jgi:hypothetical protein
VQKVEAAWGDWCAGGTLPELIPDWAGDPLADAVALRIAGALLSLVLERLDPALARSSRDNVMRSIRSPH